jgi:hypothetical protein
VLDGAAPDVKSVELVERKQQKRLAHGKLLNERRALLLHRIYVLRWYQILCVALSLLSSPCSLTSSQVLSTASLAASATLVGDEERTATPAAPPSSLPRPPYLQALYKILQTAFEWALGTEMPEWLFAQAAQTTFLAKLDAHAAQTLIDAFATMRTTVQTSFLIEFNWLDTHTDAATRQQQHIKRALSVLLDSMIETDAMATANNAPTGTQSRSTNSYSRTTVPSRPYLICVHIAAADYALAQEAMSTRHAAIDRCWQQCRAAFLVCCVVHAERPNSDDVTGTVLFPTDATAAFARWETLAAQYWCNQQTFSHQHHHIWRTIDYTRWLCSSKSNVWLASSNLQARERASDATTTTEMQLLMRFYSPIVPLAFSDVYDTRNDESHRNLLWNKKSCSLFAMANANSAGAVACSDVMDSPERLSMRANNILWRFARDFFTTSHSGSSGGSGGGGGGNGSRKRRIDAMDEDVSVSLSSSASASLETTVLGAPALNATRAKRRCERLATDVANAATTTNASMFGVAAHNEDLAVRLDERQRQHVRFRITDAYLQIVVRFLRVVCGAQPVVAEHEAEATCAKLCRDAQVDYVFTDDVDALAFGAPNVVLDWPHIQEIAKSLLLLGGTLQPAFTARILYRDSIMRHFRLSDEDFTMWCILCGTDFVQLGPSHIPVALVLRIVRSSDTLRDCVRNFQTAQRRCLDGGTSDASGGGNNEEAALVALVQHAFQFFVQNASQRQSEFLVRQFAPQYVDETINLHVICASRKMPQAITIGLADIV